MDHALRTISYIADIGDLVVLMARRRFVPHEVEDPPKINRTPKMICHVFESEEVLYYSRQCQEYSGLIKRWIQLT